MEIIGHRVIPPEVKNWTPKSRSEVSEVFYRLGFQNDMLVVDEDGNLIQTSMDKADELVHRINLPQSYTGEVEKK